MSNTDFNGDGRDDILWRNVDGRVTDWLGAPNGGFLDNADNALRSIANDWQIFGTGDFNGDSRDDILWRHSDGRITDWLGTSNGGFVDNSVNAATSVANDWHIFGTGDFNGDGRDDILWRNVDGRMTDWLGTSNGGFLDNSANALDSVGNDWQIAGTGDFNGDGRDDILWRNVDGRLTDWLGAADGGFIDNVTNALDSVGTDWQIAGTGDFNGDGRDDILWRNVDGRLTNWLGASNGGFVDNATSALRSVGTDWRIVGTGDFNGDARDDILWRNVDGRLTDWLGTSNGSFLANAANAYAGVPTDWLIQPNPTGIGSWDY